MTLLAMVVTSLVSVAMVYLLRFEAVYAVRSGPPADQGDLSQLEPHPALANQWVRGEALLGTNGAIRYSRPLDGDTFRLAPVAGNERIWVEIRVPAGNEGPHFVPPSSFVGRLVPVRQGGLRHGGLAGEVQAATRREVPADAWLLIDGESPAGVHWVLALVVLFVGFALFNLYGLYRLLRPVRDD